MPRIDGDESGLRLSPDQVPMEQRNTAREYYGMTGSLGKTTRALDEQETKTIVPKPGERGGHPPHFVRPTFKPGKLMCAGCGQEWYLGSPEPPCADKHRNVIELPDGHTLRCEACCQTWRRYEYAPLRCMPDDDEPAFETGIDTFEGAEVYGSADGENWHKVETVPMPKTPQSTRDIRETLVNEDGQEMDPRSAMSAPYGVGETGPEVPELPENEMKFDGDTVPIQLLPTIPLFCIAKGFGLGAKKYEANSWRRRDRKAVSVMRTYGSIMRHLLKWASGETWDPDSVERGMPMKHLWLAGTQLMILIEHVESGKAQDDRHINSSPEQSRAFTMNTMDEFDKFG